LYPEFDIDSIIGGIPVGVALLDSDLRIVGINRALEALTGFSLEAAMHVPAQYIIRSNLFPKESIEKAALEENKKRHFDGDIINCAREKVPVSITVSPLYNGDGKIIGAIETVQDLSYLGKLSGKIPAFDQYGEMIGHSPRMQKIKEILHIIAATDSSILITGETGTGKDLLASVAHHASPRAQGPFIKVNCGALPETLLESELFGHVRGAFTGAIRDKPGRFQLAEGGTIYLTEIGDLHLSLQVKLLSVLDDREVVPVGGTRSVKTDVRVIAATHRDLDSMVAEGTFRQDLLYRLKVVRIDLPPLRERGEDARLLLEHFLKHYKGKFDKSISGFSDEALSILLKYAYPGNVREVMNIVEYATSICQSDRIEFAHLPEYLFEDRSDVRNDMKPAEAVRDEMVSRISSLPSISDQPDQDWKQMERRLISETLIQCHGNRTKAANMLGWSRSTLWRKMKRQGLQ
jgi:PAS domain S-box-containing protein